MTVIEYLQSDYVVLVFIPVIIALLNIIKSSGFEPKFIPLLAIVLGVLIGVAYSGFELKEGVLIGIILGISAVGTYSGTTNVIEGIKSLK